MVIADRHHDAREELHPAYKLVKTFAKSFKPDFVVDLGDTLDLPYLASFNADNLKILSTGSFKKDYDLIKRELDFWQGITKDYVWLQGNHDERVDRLLERDPKLEGFVDYPSAFDLRGRGVGYFPLLEQPHKRGKLHFIHGWYATIHHAAKHLDMLAGNVVYGHVHKFQSHPKILPLMAKSIEAWSLGCLCDLAPDWKKGAPTGWQHGFAVVEIDTRSGNFNLYPIHIIQGGFNYLGRRWEIGK